MNLALSFPSEEECNFHSVLCHKIIFTKFLQPRLALDYVPQFLGHAPSDFLEALSHLDYVPQSSFSHILGTWLSFTYLCCAISYKQDEARKALESALGGKKIEYEKWDKEIKRREEAGGGDNSGGGGWFNWRRWFCGDDVHFWQEAQQASLAILVIIVMYLIVTKGDVILPVIFNPLLFTLRGARNGFTFVTSQIMRKVYPASQDSFGTISQEEVPSRVSSKDSVARKWRGD
ncbi:hypothetical protein RND71_009185 [Anisodus tanguticus]|uniref:Uncharacterized protein n=1 Tax=Anisodus tanguticus TaxID=243964 RepID=A0AAE1SH78_9SOLA|nr:hypothetical protein RND71_009185 [Anisodus tanguticus]